MPGLTASGFSVWFGFREVTAVVLQLFPAVGSRCFLVGFSLKCLETSQFWICRLTDTCFELGTGTDLPCGEVCVYCARFSLWNSELEHSLPQILEFPYVSSFLLRDRQELSTGHSSGCGSMVKFSLEAGMGLG